ncbi:type II secretion system F family protein [bacterium]
MTTLILKILVLIIFFYVTALAAYAFFIVIEHSRAVRKESFFKKFWKDYQKRLLDFNRDILHLKIKDKYLAKVTLSAVSFAGLLALIVTGNIIFLLLFIFLSYYIPDVILKQAIKKRTQRVESQLISALVLINNSLKAGLDIIQGMQLVVRDMDPPIREEFEQVINEYNLGTSFEEALINMRNRLNSKTINTFVTSIIIQRESGGNITLIMEQIINTIRETFKLEDKMSTLTSQGKMQARVILALPWVMALALLVIQPGFMIPMFTSTVGIILLLLVAFWQFIGMLVIKKIITIEV